MSERDLVVAILTRALQDACGDLSGVPKNEQRKIQKAATLWVSKKSDRPFSFIFCAEILGLDPQSIRKRLASGKISFKEFGEANAKYPTQMKDEEF